MNLWTIAAWAQEAAPQATTAAQPNMLTTLAPLGFMFLIIYFLMIRPQSKKAKLHQTFLTSLKRGDSILTSSGILGRIEHISEKIVTLEVADGVSLKVFKNYIIGPATVEEAKK